MTLSLRLARHSPIILDTSPNSRLHSPAVAAMNPHATVYGFEPIPEILAQYRQTTAQQGLTI